MTFFGWGANNYGQLCLGYVSDEEVKPKEWHGDEEIKHVRGGGGHFIGYGSGKNIFVCGWNLFGQCGVDNNKNVDILRRISFRNNILEVATGWDWTLLLDSKGYVWSSGSNKHGQLGHTMSVLGTNVFERISKFCDSAIVQITTGLRHSVLLDAEGRVYCFGCNKRGQCGMNLTRTIIVLPQLVNNLPPVKYISAGQNFTVCLSVSGEIYVFGDNKFGQIAFSNVRCVVQPTILCTEFLGCAIDYVVCGWTHLVVLLRDGKVYTRGRNCYGQLGLGDRIDRDYFEFVASHSSSLIVSGSEHVLSIDLNDRRLYAWGWNEHGNCGLNSKEDALCPCPVLLPSNVFPLRLCAGSAHNIIIST